jgi:hypothetical protein
MEIKKSFNFLHFDAIIQEVCNKCRKMSEVKMKLSIIEFFLRSIPEGFLFIYASYVFSKKAIRLRPFLLSSILLAIGVYGIQFLPIHKGINNILNITVFIILSTKVNKIDFIKSIKVVFSSIMLGFVCEGINLFLIQSVFKLDINYIFSDPKLKTIYGIPSLLIFGLVVSLYHCIKSKKKKLETTFS